MSDARAAGVRWRAEGVGYGRAILVTAVGSSPFEVGSMLLASDDGRLAGSVSDDPAIATAQPRGTRYVGALRSRRSHAQRLARLRRAGLSDQDLDRIHAPVGLDLGGRIAADFALGILSEIVSERHAHRRASLGGSSR